MLIVGMGVWATLLIGVVLLIAIQRRVQALPVDIRERILKLLAPPGKERAS